MMRLVITITLYAVALFPSIDGMANSHVIRRGNSIDEAQRTFKRGDARDIGNEKPHMITDTNEIIHQRRLEQILSYEGQKENNSLRYRSPKATSRGLKSQKSSKSKKSSNRHHNIFIHGNQEGSLSEQLTNHTALANQTAGENLLEAQNSTEATEKSSTLTHMRMDTLSQHTSIPIERNVATYVPMPAPIEIPTQASVRLPTRNQNDFDPPTRTGVSEPIDIVSDEDPCDEMDERETIYNQYQVYDENNMAMNMGSEQSSSDTNHVAVTDGTDHAVVDHAQLEESPVSRPVTRPALDGDEDKEEVGIEQDIMNNEQFVEDSRKEGTWKYVVLGIGSLLVIAFAVFFRFRSKNPDLYSYAKGGKRNSAMLEPIDNTVPLDQTGGKSGYSEMNSTKSFTDYEEKIRATPDGSVDFALSERHDPRIQPIRLNSPPLSPLGSSGSRSLYESGEEGQYGNIEDYDDEEYYDDEIEDEHVIDEESGDEEYTYDYELEEEEEEEEMELTGQEEAIDELDMEESTLSWEEEEYLSTIEEERSGDFSRNSRSYFATP